MLKQYTQVGVCHLSPESFIPSPIIRGHTPSGNKRAPNVLERCALPGASLLLFCYYAGVLCVWPEAQQLGDLEEALA